MGYQVNVGGQWLDVSGRAAAAHRQEGKEIRRAPAGLTPHQGEAVAAADAHLNNAALPTYSELLEALRACQRVLHPGAVGLIHSAHGEEAGKRAARAVNLVREALNETLLSGVA